MSKFSLLTFILFFTSALDSNASDTVPLTLNFDGIKNTTGHIIITVYKNAEEFKAEKPFLWFLEYLDIALYRCVAWGWYS